MPPERSSPESTGTRDSGIRKKMRKGTHSCFECRRRKIRCIFPPDNQNSCTECFARGSRCVDQEHAEVDVVVDHRKNLRERVARLEALVESLVDDKSYDKSEKHAAEALRSLGTGGEFSLPLTPHSEDTPSSMGVDNPSAPILSLFDNNVISRAESQKSISMASQHIVPISSPSTNTNFTYTPPQAGGTHDYTRKTRQKDDEARQALKSILPPWDQLIAILNDNEHMWAVFQRKCPGTREAGSISQFAHRVLTRGTPCEFGVLVLLYGSCVGDDTQDRALALVDRWIVSDDEYMVTLEGLECTILEGKIYADIGQARRSWLAFRRGLTFAQLMGLHHNHGLSISRGSIWWSLYGADRLTSLMLGMPYGIADSHCNMDFMGQRVHNSFHPLAFFAKIAYFAGKVIDRTQGLAESTFASALDLEQELNNYAVQMPSGWWDVAPMNASADPNVAYEWQEKMLGQMAFYQIRAYLHMPFMLKSATHGGYDNSRKACIEGAREMLRLYHMLRAVGTPLYECKAVDFVGFTGCILLVLGLLGYGRTNSHNPMQDERDWALIERSMEIFKRASSEKGGKVAAQSYEALAQLHQVKKYDCTGPETDPNQVTKIVIPFFGTISVQRGQSFRHIASPGSTTQGTPESKSLTTPPTPNLSTTSTSTDASHLSSISQQAAHAYSSMDPQIMYDGFYMPADEPTQSASAYDPQLTGGEDLSNFMPNSATAGGFGWPSNMGNMDIDQDWSWFMNDIQLQQQSQGVGMGYST